jgi:hypothetical protein
MRLGPPPKGYGTWTLRLLARKLVELEVVEAISHEKARERGLRRLSNFHSPIRSASDTFRRVGRCNVAAAALRLLVVFRFPHRAGL